jgi:hypothetical protein
LVNVPIRSQLINASTHRSIIFYDVWVIDWRAQAWQGRPTQKQQAIVRYEMKARQGAQTKGKPHERGETMYV